MPKILIVDDDPDICEMLEDLFQAAGYDTASADNGKTAMNILADESDFNLVITDIVMPEQEGIATMIELSKKYPAIKYIAISGGGRIRPESYLELARTIGAAYTFEKPLDIKELKQAVVNLIGPGRGVSPD